MYKFLIKINILLSLLSNTISFGMITKEVVLHRLNERPLLLKNEPENKQFDFLDLPENLQHRSMRFFTSDVLNAFAQTSKENYVAIEQYRQELKLLTKQYLWAMHKGEVAFAQQIKQDHSNLPLFYYYPYNRASKWEKVVECNLLVSSIDMKDNSFIDEIFEQGRLLLRKQPILSAGIFMLSSTSDLEIASLANDYNLTSTILKEMVSSGKCLGLRYCKSHLLWCTLMIAINEHNYKSATMLLDAINMIVKEKDITQFYFETLERLKIIKNKEAFALVVNKIPLHSYYVDKRPLTLLAEQSDLFDENDRALIEHRKKELEKDLPLLEAKNKPFDLFNLPKELQLMIVQFIRSADTVRAFAATSNANNATIEQYKEIQKPLTKKYFCAVHEGDRKLAKQIKRDNPNLPLFYHYPYFNIAQSKKIYPHILLNAEGAWPTPKEQRIIKKQQWFEQSAGDIFILETDDIAIACLSGNCDKVIECLKKKDIKFSELLGGLGIAIQEHNNLVSALLLDKINEILVNSEIRIAFYCNMLWMSKKIERQDIFKLVVDKIFASFSQLLRFNQELLIEKIVSFMSKDNIFNKDDVALVQLRGKVLEEELQKIKIVRRENQHCTIL